MGDMSFLFNSSVQDMWEYCGSYQEQIMEYGWHVLSFNSSVQDIWEYNGSYPGRVMEYEWYVLAF